ncbi:T9SS type A sorting domain-containing protein [Wenyingzhuangia sp. IMCC45467]
MKKTILSFLTIATAFSLNAQVVQVKEINNSGTSSSSPANLFVYQNHIYFAADDSSGSNSPNGEDLGKELWKSDGTESGTVLVKDLRIGSSNSSPNFFFSYNDMLYFSANSGGGNVLFSTDGTEEGTNATGGPFIFNQVELNNKIYYVNTVDGNKLYEFNGTTASAVTNAGTGIENVVGANIVAFNNKLYLYMDYSEDEPTVGRELYVYDPETGVFSLIKDVDAGTGDSSISNFTVVANTLFFEADNALWMTDGTTEGTQSLEVALSVTGVNNFYGWNGTLFFEGDDGAGDQLWSYTKETNVLTKLSNVAGENSDHDPSDYVVYDGYLYYSGKDANDTDKHLFRTNGTTVQQMDTAIKDVDDLVEMNGIIYFEGDNGATGNELYRFDPESLSTSSVLSKSIKIYPNPAQEYIVVPSELIGDEYSIVNITGSVVKKGFVVSEKIDLNLSSGVYIISFKTSKGLASKKLVIKN